MFISKKLSFIVAAFVALAPIIALCGEQQNKTSFSAFCDAARSDPKTTLVKLSTNEPLSQNDKIVLSILSSQTGGLIGSLGFSKYLEGRKLAKKAVIAKKEDVLITAGQLKEHAQSMKSRGNARIAVGLAFMAPVAKIFYDISTDANKKTTQESGHASPVRQCN